VEPALSPDGQSVAFCTRDGRIQVVPAQGGLVRTLARDATTDTVHLGSPAWSPDGRWICYRSQRRLFVVGRDGGPARPATTDADPSSVTGGAWSPDGRWLVYTGVKQGRFVLARVAPSGGGAATIGEEAQALGWPSFSPDGRWLVGATAPPQTEGSSLWALPVWPNEGRPGTPLRILGGVFQHYRPSMSADSRRLAFEIQDSRLSVGRVPLETAGGPHEPEPLKAGGMLIQPAVSHRGDAVALVSDRLGSLNLWRMPTVGVDLDILREGAGIDEKPAWSPDDTQVAFSHLAKGTFRIAVMSSSGGSLTFASEPDVAARDPAWSPDGRRIAFAARQQALGSLRVVPADGGMSQVLATAPWILSQPSWSPDGQWIAVAVLSPDADRIAVVAASGGPLREVMRDARTPLWLPGGRLLSLRRNRSGAYDLQVASVGPDGTRAPGTETLLTRLPRKLSIEPDRLSSDGRFVYFGLREMARSEVWLAEAP
jgi:Tol biopolymer transport system component